MISDSADGFAAGTPASERYAHATDSLWSYINVVADGPAGRELALTRASGAQGCPVCIVHLSSEHGTKTDAATRSGSRCHEHVTSQYPRGWTCIASPGLISQVRVLQRFDPDVSVVRDTARLGAERIDTELGAVLVTTAEQTVLDLVKRPGRGDVEGEVWPTVEQLYQGCDQGILGEIADAQKMRTTFTRLQDRLGERR